MEIVCTVLYSHLLSVWMYHVFPHHLINGTNFGKKTYGMQIVCFDFLYNSCLNHYLYYQNNSMTYYHKCTCLHVQFLLFCQI